MQDFSGKTILVVDDEKLLRDYFVEEFRDLGAFTLSAANSREAINVIQHQKVDVILTDVRMPDGDGISLLKEVTTCKHPPLVFFMTGYADIDLDEAINLGAATIFNKPCDFQTIASEISNHLRA